MMVFQDLQVTQDLAEIQAKMGLLDQPVFLGPSDQLEIEDRLVHPELEDFKACLVLQENLESLAKMENPDFQVSLE